MRAGEVIAKLAEDAYFMRVDNRVAQPPPARNEATEDHVWFEDRWMVASSCDE
jgi:hypothetical protein